MVSKNTRDSGSGMIQASTRVRAPMLSPSTRHNHRRWLRIGLGVGLGLVLCAVIGGLAAALIIPAHVQRSTATRVLALADAPARPVAIVLGAKIWGDEPSHMLEDRLAAALALYQTGRCEKILLTGAHRSEADDEVGVMRRWLEARGVPADDLYLDHAGLRTFDSMVRARRVFGVERALVISQDFHVPRAVYIGERVGLDLVGVVAPAGYRYPGWLHRHNAIRERAAQVRAWLDVHVLGTQPRHLGPAIDLTEPGSRTH